MSAALTAVPNTDRPAMLAVLPATEREPLAVQLLQSFLALLST